MKTAKEWMDAYDPNWSDDHGRPELTEEVIRAIQNDALGQAADVAIAHKWQKGSVNFNQGFIAGRILALRSDAKELYSAVISAGVEPGKGADDVCGE